MDVETRKMGSSKRRWWLLLLTAPAWAALGFVLWAVIVPAPMPEALSALQPDEHILVEVGRWIAYRPPDQDVPVGLILYPGGRVDYRAYAPAARAIAAQGYLVVIVRMPLNLAVFAPDRAGQVIRAFPEVERWAVGGHSLGGSMAARFAYRHPDQVQGLVLWASYPAATDDLSTRHLAVASIFGTLDGLATGSKIEASRAFLPATTRWVAIEGGNHAQFGWYGPQSGDNEAAISRSGQQARIVEATVELLKAVAASQP
jgi:predicted esterase